MKFVVELQMRVEIYEVVLALQRRVEIREFGCGVADESGDRGCWWCSWRGEWRLVVELQKRVETAEVGGGAAEGSGYR
jgi:hypothetical protein